MKCYSNDGLPQSSYWDLSLGEAARGIFFYSAILLVMAVTAI